MNEVVLPPLSLTTASFNLDMITAEGCAQVLAPNFDKGVNSHPPRRYTTMATVSLRVTAQDMVQLLLAYTRARKEIVPFGGVAKTKSALDVWEWHRSTY